MWFAILRISFWYAQTILTNAGAVCGRPTPKDVLNNFGTALVLSSENTYNRNVHKRTQMLFK